LKNAQVTSRWIGLDPAVKLTIFLMAFAILCSPAWSASSSSVSYEVTVPDTLDLAARGTLALHALTSIPEEKFKYDTEEGSRGSSGRVTRS
jgi:hypothetical protein